MSLPEFQKVLLRLYTDRPFLEHFYAEGLPEGEYDLSAAELSALGSLPRPLMEDFHNSLASKRVGMMRKQLRARPELVVCSDFYKKGPVLLFYSKNNEERMVEISTPTLKLARALEQGGAPLTFGSILQAYTEHETISLRAVMKLGWISGFYGVTGRFIRCQKT